MMYLPDQGIDFAILEREEGESENYLKTDMNPIKEATVVDVLGYPGALDESDFLKHHQERGLSNGECAIAKSMIAPYVLTLTCGNLEKDCRCEKVCQHKDSEDCGCKKHCQDTADCDCYRRYDVSTCWGMSGGPVVKNGKAIGIALSKIYLIVKVSILVRISKIVCFLFPYV